MAFWEESLRLLRWLLVDEFANTVSLLGVILTVGFSFGASRAARAAKRASEATAKHFSQMSLLQELTELSRLMDDLGHRIEGRSWEMVAERGSAIRLRASAILARDTNELSEEIRTRVGVLIGQMRSLSDAALKARHGGREPPVPRSASIVVDQQETLLLAMSEVRNKIGDQRAN